MGFVLTNLVVIGTDCIGSYKSNYHMITTTMAITLPYVAYNSIQRIVQADAISDARIYIYTYMIFTICLVCSLPFAEPSIFKYIYIPYTYNEMHCAMADIVCLYIHSPNTHPYIYNTMKCMAQCLILELTLSPLPWCDFYNSLWLGIL
jgi:hypothetical protein